MFVIRRVVLQEGKPKFFNKRVVFAQGSEGSEKLLTDAVFCPG